MMLFSELITDMRVELDDSSSTRWNDDQLLSFIKRAVRRIHDILVKNNIEFAQSSQEYNIVSGTSNYDLPADFMIPMGLYNVTTRKQFIHISKDTGLRVKSSATCGYYSIIGNELVLDGPPTSAFTLTLYYYPIADTSITTASSLPYSAKLADSLLLYSCLLAKNVDEMDVSIDVSMLQDIETTIVNLYGRIEPAITHLEGDTTLFP